jgi:hypothetical protein
MKRFTGIVTMAAAALFAALLSNGRPAAAQQSYADTVLLKAHEIRDDMAAASGRIQQIADQAEKRKAELARLKADVQRQAAAMPRTDPQRALVLKRYDDALAAYYVERDKQEAQVRKYKDQIQANLKYLNENAKYQRYADVAEARKAVERTQAAVHKHEQWRSSFRGPGTLDTVATGPQSGTPTFGIQPNPNNLLLNGRPTQQVGTSGAPPVGNSGPVLGVRHTRVPSGPLNVPSAVTFGAVFINNTDQWVKMQVELVSENSNQAAVENSRREPIWLGPRQTSGEYTWRIHIKAGGTLPVHLNRHVLEVRKS